MKAFEVKELLEDYQAAGKLYFEFLHEPSMSMGLYKLAVGAVDPQTPHKEDEAYYVLSGAGKIRVGEEDRPVKAGSIVFVAQNTPHRFHSITEDLTIMVIFAPAETD